MTVIEFKEYGIEAHGHSNAPRVNDSDLVCCAVSTLVCTLAYSVQKWWDDGKLQKLPVIDTDAGNAVIYFEPKQKYKNEIRAAFDVIKSGLTQLSKQYGDYICVC